MLKGVIFPLDDMQQTHRIRRFLMGAAAAMMVLLLLALLSSFGILPWRGFAVASAMMIALLAAFYVAFRLGFNKRFADPSLTLGQIVASTTVILYCLYESPRGHGILALIYMVSFLFGVFRLTTRELLGLTGFVAVSYGLILAIQGREVPDIVRIGDDVARWIVLVSVLTFFSFMGGYIGRLRRNLSVTNAQLGEAMSRIEQLAARDELTGVLNRRSLVEALNLQQSRADRHGVQFSLLVIDIDHFKRVNDTYGHPAGDAVLAGFAASASAILRQNDSFGRYGGEEFLAVLDQTPLAQALIVAERMRALAGELTFAGCSEQLRISVSIGVAQHKAREEWKATVERADRSLYRAKNSGRDRVEREESAAQDESGSLETR